MLVSWSLNFLSLQIGFLRATVSQSERLYEIRHLFNLGQCLAKLEVLNELGNSPAILKRDIAHLRSHED